MSAPQTLARPLARRAQTISETPAPLPEAPPIPAQVIDAAVDALRRGETHYTDRPGIQALRQPIADDLNNRYAISISADDITITCGETEARFVAVRLLALANSSVVCPGDASSIAGAVHLADAKLTKTTELNMDVSLLYLTPNDDRDIVKHLLAGAVEHDWWVIWDMSDTPDADFHPLQDYPLANALVTIGGLSDRMPGWRVGWLAGSGAANKLRAFKLSMTICTTSVSQWAAVAMLEGSE